MTDDVLPLAAFVPTLPKAVDLALAEGIGENCLFIYARLIKAFEATVGVTLKPDELRNAFSLWWNTARPLLPTTADFDEYRFDFEASLAKVRAPWGANPLEEAIRRADLNPGVPHADRYPSPKIKRVIAVCYHLQMLSDDAPFFLALRDAARIVGLTNLNKVSGLMDGLVRDQVLIEVERGKPGGTRSTRYRFNFPPTH